jgi:hypothetical protein
MSEPTSRRNHAAWIGPLVGLIGVMTYFTVAVRFPYFRDTAVVNLILVVFGVAIAAWGVRNRRSWRTWIGLGAAAVFASLLFGYIFVLSSQIPSPETAVAIGSQAPPLDLPDQSGRVASLDNYLDRRVLVVFYRGFW